MSGLAETAIEIIGISLVFVIPAAAVCTAMTIVLLLAAWRWGWRRVAFGISAVLAPALLVVLLPSICTYVERLWGEVPPSVIAQWSLEAAVCACFGAVLCGHVVVLAKHTSKRYARMLAWISFCVTLVLEAALIAGGGYIWMLDIPHPYELHLQAAALGAYLVLAIALSISSARAPRVDGE